MRQIARFSLLRLYRRQIPLNLLLFVGGAGVKTRRLFWPRRQHTATVLPADRTGLRYRF
ncbi:hypothetical protein [Escherichia coli]|uniref:hypothetical protein n=1 Tax=Escherichia coli TaxID=562 RepID=UPI0039BE4891